MAVDIYAYDDDNDADLAYDMIEDSSKTYLYQHHIKNKNGTLNKGTPAASTLTIAATTVTADEHNDGLLYLLNDDGDPCVFTVADTADSSGDAVITFDITSPLIPAGVDQTAKFTASGTYPATVTGKKRFVGYSDDPVFNPDTATTDIEVNMPRKKLRTRIDSIKGTVEWVLRSSPKTLLDILGNMVSLGGSPDVWYQRDMDADMPVFGVWFEDIYTIDKNETREEFFPNVEFTEPAQALGGPTGTDGVTYQMTGSTNEDSVLNTIRFNKSA